jgi:hypothetical protein
MDKVLFATTNQQKIKRLSLLTKVKLISLDDLEYKIDAPEEVGEDALTISIAKARYYYSHLKEKMPVLTQDDTLKLEVRPEDDPKNHIKESVVKKYGEFTDQDALEYYTDMAKRYGGSIPMYFEYGHALCFDDGEESVKARKSSLVCRLVAEPHENESTKGYFLSAITQVEINNEWKYYSELNPGELIIIDFGIKDSLEKLLQ